jgi:hypothetical protein
MAAMWFALKCSPAFSLEPRGESARKLLVYDGPLPGEPENVPLK